MTKGEHGGGSVKPIRNRRSGVLEGYQAFLPRSQSTPPKDCKNPKDYREPLGPPQETKHAAREILNAALVERIQKRSLTHGLPLASHVAAEIKGRLQDAKREYRSDERARKSTAGWRSIDKVWLSKAGFYDWPPSRIDIGDLQVWFDWLRDEGLNQRTGEPLSGNFIRNVAAFVRAVFDRARVLPNPVDSVKLPAKNDPRVSYMDLAVQQRFFRTKTGPQGDGDPGPGLEDLVMTGCGTGGGLRIGELLSMEAADVFLDDADPHLMVRFGGDHHAPTKGRRVRRVELFEPGLGFWKLWMARFYAGGARVFAGPKGGYLKAWPERFPGWSAAAGKKLTSHIMRHTYAVAMLSGTWGYEPKSLEFVKEQLDHADRATTEKYYGAFEHGTWQREVRRMTGRAEEKEARKVVTAIALLGPGALNGASSRLLAKEIGDRGASPSLTQSSKSQRNLNAAGASSPHSDSNGGDDGSEAADFETALAEAVEDGTRGMVRGAP